MLGLRLVGSTCVGGHQLLDHAIAALRDAEADVWILPVVDCVVASQHGLAQDEEVRPEGRLQIHGHEPWLAETPNIGCGGFPQAAGRAVGLLPHVVLRTQLQRQVRRDSDAQDRSRGLSAVHVVSHCRRREELREAREVLLRHAEVRGARVHDAAAGAVLAHVQLDAVDAHGGDVHLPVAEVGHGHRRPLQRVQHALLVDAAHGDLALLAVLALGEEDAEVGGADLAAADQHVVGAEVAVHREAVQAQAEDAVEVERLEGLRGHLDRQNDAHLHAQVVAVLGLDVLGQLLGGVREREGAVLRDACAPGPLRSRLPGRSSLGVGGGSGIGGRKRLEGVRRLVEADLVTGELAGDLAGAEANGNLVSQLTLDHSGAAGLDRNSSGGVAHVEAAVHEARLALALGGGQHDVPGAGVEDDAELLRRRADAQDAGVGGLERGHLATPVDGHRLAAQADDVRHGRGVGGRLRRLLADRDGGPLEQVGQVGLGGVA
mmetsp:Transcript_22743/g.57987  ORF Transcript_22743/g.57987 Transcript_22743/m.57987 type:complete len:489 (+) Transcript_22743:160-1626(+)